MNSYIMITGASAGIGKAYAYALAERGYNLILVARRGQLLKEIADDIKNKHDVTVLFYDLDITEKKSCETLIKNIKKDIPQDEFVDGTVMPLSMLINNAGFGDFGEFQKCDVQKHLGMIDLNIRALVELTHRCIPLISQYVQTGNTRNVNTQGYVVNLGSVAGFQPGPYMANYYATKAYVLSFTEAVAEECDRQNNGVHVCVVCPGPTQSEFGDVAGFVRAGSKFADMFTRNGNKIPTAHTLVAYSLKKVFAKQRIIIHGASFKFSQFLIRLLPRSRVTQIVANFQGGKQTKNN